MKSCSASAEVSETTFLRLSRAPNQLLGVLTAVGFERHAGRSAAGCAEQFGHKATGTKDSILMVSSLAATLLGVNEDKEGRASAFSAKCTE